MKKILKVGVVSMFLVAMVLYAVGTTNLIDEIGVTSPSVNATLINGVHWVDSTFNLQEKLDLCGESGCTIILPPGTYQSTGYYNITSNYTKIIGQGRSTILNHTVNMSPIFDIKQGLHDIEIRDFTTNGEALWVVQGQTGTVNTTVNWNIKIDNIHSYNMNGGSFALFGRETLDRAVENLTISNNFADGLKQGVVFSGHHADILHNTFYGDNSSTENEGIELNWDDTSNVRIIGNTIANFREEGIDIRCHQCQIKDNIIERIGNLTFGTGMNTALCYNCQIIDNTINNVTYIGIRPGRGNTVSGNKITCDPNAGSQWAILATGEWKTQISGNSMKACTTCFSADATAHNLTRYGNQYLECGNDISDLSLDKKHFTTSLINASENIITENLTIGGTDLEISVNGNDVKVHNTNDAAGSTISLVFENSGDVYAMTCTRAGRCCVSGDTGICKPSSYIFQVNGTALFQTNDVKIRGNSEAVLTIDKSSIQRFAGIHFDLDGVRDFVTGVADAGDISGSGGDEWFVGPDESTSYLWIEPTGNIGINNTNPSHTLTVEGNANITGNIYMKTNQFVMWDNGNITNNGTFTRVR